MKNIHLIILEAISKIILTNEAMDVTDALYESFADNYENNVALFRYDIVDHLNGIISEAEAQSIAAKIIEEINEEIGILAA